jgi:MazG family protein
VLRLRSEVTLPRGKDGENRDGLPDGFAGLVALMDRLLAEDGCPWDRAQTLDTLRPYLLEEAHEVLESMHDPEAHRKELGDLLFQIVFHSALREREGQFGIEDVIASIRDKMIRRHPHVFGERDETGRPRISSTDVAAKWEQIKAAERGGEGPPTPLAGVPQSLPALARAWRLQDKAAAVGFDWPDVAGALAKFDEEWAEFEQARANGTPDELRDEFGDLLFVLVRIGQKLGLDAEDALRRANGKFERRFAFVMERCHDAGVAPLDAGLDRLEAWWVEAKQRERAGS